MSEVSEFSPHQIVCLEHHNRCLYGEVIQVIESRKMCWVRPLFLAILADDIHVYSQLFPPKILIDVRLTSDLLYPTKLFRSAFDTEVIPLLNELESQDYSAEKIQIARQQLRQFIVKIWQDNPEEFK
ncbi:oxidoreductase [Aphanothece sacrum FPU1]|uniref:Oxidoreductase n=1 Tax=Aphanothece sacrum FPU1 TaxID=1920663 RepID=A0A401IMF5_APHSA|nr:oxidoreductase [Aphanothece sacrum FPU1]GBF84408.1 oxidoreductase, FAD-binding protein [Aphanothece sacrum FPU3]